VDARLNIPISQASVPFSIASDIRPRKIALILAVFALYFTAQSLVNEYVIEIVLGSNYDNLLVLALDLFSVNAEETIPTWYATLLLFGAAVLLALIGRAHSTDRRYWLGLAVIFLYLSVDEGAVIHEMLTDPLQAAFDTSGYLEFAWLIAAIPLVLLVGLLYLRFVLRLPGRTRSLFIVAGGLYIGGAVVVEAFSANRYAIGGGVTYAYLAIASIEECAEMLGVILFIYALLDYMVSQSLTFSWQAPVSDQPAARTGGAARLIGLAIGILIAINGVLVIIAFTQEPVIPQTVSHYPQIIDELATETVTVTRLVGTFGPANEPARRVVATLLDVYAEVVVVTFPAGNYSFALAGDTLPFDRETLMTVLHDYGEIQFIIYETAAARLLADKP